MKSFLLNLLKITTLLAMAVIFGVFRAQATPTQYEASGLLNQPTADTLDSGNISAGLWLNPSQRQNSDNATIVPVSLAQGLGSFLAAYGSFPNLQFKDEETASGRGFANLGFKACVLGKCSSSMQNFNLSLQRVSAVKDFLQQQGEKTELFMSGYGEIIFSTVKLSEQRRVDVAVYQANRTIKQLFQESDNVERFVIQ